MATPQTRTLTRALKIAGSDERLAQHLACSTSQLTRWLAGDEATPPVIYLKVLDLVSQGRRPVPRRDK